MRRPVLAIIIILLSATTLVPPGAGAVEVDGIETTMFDSETTCEGSSSWSHEEGTSDRFEHWETHHERSSSCRNTTTYAAVEVTSGAAPPASAEVRGEETSWRESSSDRSHTQSESSTGRVTVDENDERSARGTTWNREAEVGADDSTATVERSCWTTTRDRSYEETRTWESGGSDRTTTTSESSWSYDEGCWTGATVARGGTSARAGLVDRCRAEETRSSQASRASDGTTTSTFETWEDRDATTCRTGLDARSGGVTSFAGAEDTCQGTSTGLSLYQAENGSSSSYTETDRSTSCFRGAAAETGVGPSVRSGVREDTSRSCILWDGGSTCEASSNHGPYARVFWPNGPTNALQDGVVVWEDASPIFDEVPPLP